MRVVGRQMRAHWRNGVEVFGKGGQILLGRHRGWKGACHWQTARYCVVGWLTPIDRGVVAGVPASDQESGA